MLWLQRSWEDRSLCTLLSPSLRASVSSLPPHGGNPIIPHFNSTPPVKSPTSQMFPIKKGGPSAQACSLTAEGRAGKEELQWGASEMTWGQEAKERQHSRNDCAGELYL